MLDTTTGGSAGDVTPAGPTQVEITSPVSVNVKLGADTINIREVKCEKRDVYMLNLAVELFKAMNHKDTQSAEDNAAKAIKYAMTFWNTACGWYADELADDGKKKGKYTFSPLDKP